MINEEAIFEYLLSNGMSISGACGIMGNIQVESSGNTEAYNANEGAIGLCQWEGSRRTALQHFAAGMARPETDLQAQLAFLVWESSQRGNWQAVKDISDAASAAAYWDENFEVSAGTTRAQRETAAASFFALHNPVSPTPAAPAPEPVSNVYVVKDGDTLSSIGAEHHVDWHEIYDANRAEIGDNPDKIYPGQQLIIPDVPAPAPTPQAETPPAPLVTSPTPINYTVQEGDTLSAIGERFGVDWHTIAAENALANPDMIFPGQALTIRPATAPRIYTVQEGDTLSGIGNKLNINWNDLYNRNRDVIGSNPDKIYAGQILEY